MATALVSIASLSGCKETIYVNFYNYDGTLLWQTPYVEGMSLKYGGDKPTKESDEQYDYFFDGWNHTLDEVYLYKNFYAQYEKQLRSYSVSFYNYDGSYLKSFVARYGENVADQAPAAPSRSNELRTHYYFSGWSVDLTYVTSPIIAYATYSTVPAYKIEYRDYDGSYISTEYVEQGSSSNYTIDRNRVLDNDHYYVFSNWSEPVINVKNDMTVTAEYKVVNACTVTFRNYDDTFLGTDKGPAGFTASYNGTTPQRSGYTSGYYTYTYSFSGWSSPLTNVTYDKTVYAEYNLTSKYYNKEYEDALEQIRSNAMNTSYDSDTGRYYKGFDVSMTTTRIVAGYGEVDSSTNVVDLFYSLSTYQSGYWAGGAVTIFFDQHKPGDYGVLYKYVAGGSTAALGYFHISNYFSSSSSVYFDDFTNLSTATQSQHADMAKSLVSTCLTSAKTCSWINTKNLGFSNY